MSFVSTAVFPSTTHYDADASYQGSLSLNNTQKLFLPTNTVVGTRVRIIDWQSASLSRASQQLTAPSAAQGGVFVSGGTQDGIYTDRGTEVGKRYYNVLGQASDPGGFAVFWDSVRWTINDIGGDGLYYSLSNVATPDLASNWKNNNDDTPASITVTSVTQGELDAGLTVTGSGTPEINKVHLKNQANSNGRPSYDQIDLAFDDLTFEPSGGNWQWAATYSSTNTAFPWQAVYSLNGSPAPVPAVTRNNVASEANWTSI